jgi:hypothetical protein
MTHPLRLEPADAVPENLRRVIAAVRDSLALSGLPSQGQERLLLFAFEAGGAIRVTWRLQSDMLAEVARDPRLHQQLKECAVAAENSPTRVIVLAFAGVDDYWMGVVDALTGAAREV